MLACAGWTDAAGGAASHDTGTPDGIAAASPDSSASAPSAPSASASASAQPADSASAGTRLWTLEDCLDYALEHNISLREQRNTLLSSIEDSRAAKGALMPSVSASSTQGLSHYATGEDKTQYSGTYNLSADIALYQGGKLRDSYRKSLLQNEIDSLGVAEAATDIRISIVQAYMQCLYSRESVSVSESAASTSKAQMERGEQLRMAGSISKVDYAQLQSQYQSDEYQLTVSRNTLASDMLTLKQLLELDILDEMEIADIRISPEQVLALIPDKREVFENAKAYMPQMLKAQKSIESARYSLSIAKAGYLPTLSLSAGIGSSNNSVASGSFGSQIADNFNQTAGLTLRVPIFSQLQNKTSTAKAKIALDNSRLEALSVEKDLLKNVESTYLAALSAQSQYVAAERKSAYASDSYDLVSEQFSLGAKNTVELLTAQNERDSAMQESVLAKYTSLMNLAVLDIYQGKYPYANENKD